MPRLLTITLLIYLMSLSAAFAQVQAPSDTLEAQTPSLGLFADRISYDQKTGTLTLEGNVTVLSQGRVLRAEKIFYDNNSQTLTIDDSFIVQQPDGSTLSGRGGAFSTTLEDGLLLGFRTIIEDDLIVAAAGAQRSEGRYIALSKAVASTCELCGEEETPAWQLRADRIVYDQEKSIVHYENAIFDLFGVPVFYFPYLRHPGPNQARASGLLAPSITNSNRYGLAIKTPYYMALSPSADATVTPFVTQSEGTIFETEYRQLFDAASLNLYTSVLPNSNDTAYDERWHFLGDADIALTERTTARVNIELISDDSYLDEFGYARPDRLPSSVGVDQFREDGFWSISARTYISRREGEKQSTVPVVLPDAEIIRIADRTGRYGGTVQWRASTAQLLRENGRDTTRLSVGTGIARSGNLPFGLFIRSFADLDADLFYTNDDPNFRSDPVYRLRPLAGIEASLPFFRRTEQRSETIEPIVQFIFAGQETGAGDIPNEDSQQVDFDETNLFAKSRFPGEDRFESGNRIDLGLRYQRITALGWNTTATIGQVIRQQPVDSFSSGTGLDGTRSSTVTALSFDYKNQFGLDSRALVDTEGEITRSEVLGRYSDGRYRLNGSYVFLKDESESGTPTDRTEFALSAGVPLSAHWNGEASFRRNIETQRLIESRIAALWATDCAEVSVSASRDFTRSETVVPSTEYAIIFRFNGIGDQSDGVRRTCTQF